MITQRVNVNIVPDNAVVFYIEEYHPAAGWVTVGDSFDHIELAQSIVNLFNARQIRNKIKDWSILNVPL